MRVVGGAVRVSDARISELEVNEVGVPMGNPTPREAVEPGSRVVAVGANDEVAGPHRRGGERGLLQLGFASRNKRCVVEILRPRFPLLCNRHRYQCGAATALLLVVAGLVLVPLLVFSFYEARKAYLDSQVRRLCAIDGGVTVFERVRLPAERLKGGGMVNFYQANQGENALGPEYLFRREVNHLRRGNPELFRQQTQVVRRLDGKLLGRSVFYTRAGGDMPGPWNESSFMCPELGAAHDVLRQVFVKE